MNPADLQGWDRLRHGGLLLDAPRQSVLAEYVPEPLSSFSVMMLRKRTTEILDNEEIKNDRIGEYISLVLQQVCGFVSATGHWKRGSQIPAEWGRVAITGETVKPRQLWQGTSGGVLPVFIEREKRVGVGRGRRLTSQVLQWLRAGTEQLALITNGRQWRLVFAGLDFDAWCEWDVDLWLEEGELSSQVTALRTLIQPALWTSPEDQGTSPLLQAILDSRKGQAELSQVLGERVREAVEVLVQSHGEALKEQCSDVDPADIYRAAVRVVMRMVVVLFAESRELLPRDNALYHSAYGISGLLEELEKTAARGGGRLARSWNAWPRILALFQLVHQGSHHPSLPVPAYGGDLFESGSADSSEGLTRALAVFENACFDHEVLPDRDVHNILDRITRTRVKLRQGRTSTWVPAPVDFSDLSSEYIGILYEGLLDFELKTAPAGDPVIFLAVGNQPALPLSRLEEMDDKALKNLLVKMKDTSSDDEKGAEEQTEAVDEPIEVTEDAEDDLAEAEVSAGEETDVVCDEDEDEPDERHSTRTRAEEWARRAVEIGRLAKKPRGTMTPERKLVFEETIARKARQLVTRVVLPGEWYLIRWGGTRKGSGTFYTRPGLAVPTVQRTLRPLAWNPPASEDGTPDRSAPAVDWTPKKPEEILALKVVDPGCGSGTFPVAVLRFLTDALYASLHHHGRIHEQGDRAMVALLTSPESTEANEERLCEELLPCRPDDDLFEPRLKAVLRRHVVERCIYGVDLDPLAVELCRLALWIETMDRTLPFSFLDHKIKCGNALIGAWFDQFQHYPAMAWKNREGGDKSHSNGVHFEKNVQTRAIKAFVKDVLTPDLASHLIPHAWVGMPPTDVHDEAVAVLEELHAMPVVDAAERAKLYRERLVGSESWQDLKIAFDRWCACWFWPTDRLDDAPLPSCFTTPSKKTEALAAKIAAAKRFFHWELEFPDVFQASDSGFHAVLGNPPWEIAKPISQEFFSNIDPLYRAYGKQEALKKQTEYFTDEEIERNWLNYNADFRAQSNLLKYMANPFGDPDKGEKSPDRFSLARGRQNQILHKVWREGRASDNSYVDPHHPYRYQGSADINLYKLFLEQSLYLMGDGGRMGLIVPSGIYADDGTGALREQFLKHCRWEWIFGFENREKVFDIDSRFKFNPIIIETSSKTWAVRTAFMRRNLDDWEQGEKFGTEYTTEQIERFSPHSKAIFEIQSASDLEILEKIYDKSELLGDEGWGVQYQREFDLSNDSHLWKSAPFWSKKGLASTPLGFWVKKSGSDSESRNLLPLYQGKMIWQYDHAFSAYGKNGKAKWEEQPWGNKVISPQYLMAGEHHEWSSGIKLVIRDVSSPTNRRTVIASCIPDFPCGHKTPVLRQANTGWKKTLVLSTVLNSLAFDYVVRLRFAISGGGGSLIWALLREMPLWKLNSDNHYLVELLSEIGLQLLGDWRPFAPLVCARFDNLESNEDLRPASDELRRLELRCIADALNFFAFGINYSQALWIVRDCDHPSDYIGNNEHARKLGSKLFWRVDRKRNPECRHPVLSLVALKDLENIVGAGRNPEEAIRSFVKNWRIPEKIRLKDYGLGRDLLSEEWQSVRGQFDTTLASKSKDNIDPYAMAISSCKQLFGESWRDFLPAQEDSAIPKGGDEDTSAAAEPSGQLDIF
jgi:hypothetical protein